MVHFGTAYIDITMNGKTKTGIAVALSAAAFALITATRSYAESSTLETVPSLDLKRYVGTWYEIGRYPNRFQKKCSSDTTANYTLREDGKIQVVNTCRKADGTLNTARATARVVDSTTNAKLKVTFFWPFSGDYWVIGLGKNYEYAIVGEPSRKYLWILSRTPQMDPALYKEAIQTIRSRGYDPGRLMLTNQAAATASRAGD